MLDIKKYFGHQRLMMLLKNFLLMPGEATPSNKFYLKGLLANQRRGRMVELKRETSYVDAHTKFCSSSSSSECDSVSSDDTFDE